MPIYEFTCKACGAPTEVMQRVGDPPPRCSACGSKRMARAVSRTSFHLKGGGWYADLYATPKPPGEAKEEAKTPAAESGTAAAATPSEKGAAPATPPAAASPAAASPAGTGAGTPAARPAPAAPSAPTGRTRRSPSKPRR